MEETTFDNLKKGLLELLKGYPDYAYFGKFEYFLKKGKSSIKVLSRHKLIEIASKKESKELDMRLTEEQWELLRKEGTKKPIWYRLTEKGVDLAVSLINLERSDKMLQSSKIVESHSKTMKSLTWIIAILTLFLSLEIIIKLIKNFI